MGEEIEFENGQNGRISDFNGLLTLTLDPGMVITFFISHRVLPVYRISSKLKKLFVDGRTEFATYSIRLTSKVWKSTYKGKTKNQVAQNKSNLI